MSLETGPDVGSPSEGVRATKRSQMSMTSAVALSRPPRRSA
jgi:hypothetical protein